MLEQAGTTSSRRLEEGAPRHHLEKPRPSEYGPRTLRHARREEPPASVLEGVPPKRYSLPNAVDVETRELRRPRARSPVIYL